MLSKLLPALQRYESLFIVVWGNALLQVKTLDVILRADNARCHVLSAPNKTWLIRPYAVLVRLRIQIPILRLRQLVISVLNSNLWSSYSFHNLKVSGFFMPELGRVHPYAIVLAVTHRLLLFGNKWVESAITAIVSRATNRLLAWFLLAWGIKSLNTSHSHRLCARPCWGSLRNGLVVIVFKDLLSVNLEWARDVDWYRLLHSRSFLKEAEFRSSLCQLDCIFLAWMLFILDLVRAIVTWAFDFIWDCQMLSRVDHDRATSWRELLDWSTREILLVNDRIILFAGDGLEATGVTARP